MASLRDYWVTAPTAPGCTRDFRVRAHSAWSAGWLFSRLHPGCAVLLVRQVR